MLIYRTPRVEQWNGRLMTAQLPPILSKNRFLVRLIVSDASLAVPAKDSCVWKGRVDHVTMISDMLVREGMHTAAVQLGQSPE